MARRRGAMVASCATVAFVLRTYDFGEGDRIVVAVSPEAGRIEGVVRGARRFRSRTGAALELLSLVRLSYRERPGRDLVSIERVELVSSSFGLLSTPETLEVFSHVAELARAVAKPAEKSDLLVRLLASLLDAARALPAGGSVSVDPRGPAAEKRAAGALDLLRLYFDVWVSRLEGFWPSLEACSACGRELTGPRRVGIHSGGALCLACGTGGREAVVAVSEKATVLVQRLLTLGPLAAATLEVDRSVHDEVARLASALLTTHLEQELRTMPSSIARRALR